MPPIENEPDLFVPPHTLTPALEDLIRKAIAAERESRLSEKS